MTEKDAAKRTDAAPALSAAERQVLKGRAHGLSPVVMIGAGGVTDAVTAEIDRALARHELIKIRVLGDDRDARATMLDALCARTGAAPVQHIGKILVVYRPLPPEVVAAQQAAERAAAAARSPAKARRDAGSAKPPRAKPKPAVPGRVLGRAMPKARRARGADAGQPAVAGRKPARGR